MTDFARYWSNSLAEAVYVPLPPAERERILAGFATRLHRVATGAHPDPAEPRRVGADLVTAGFRTPEVLGRTITLVVTHLAPSTGLTGTRLTELVESLTTGFTRALRAHTLDEQEEMRIAATRAQVRAERALHAKEAEFHHLASHDPVTLLPNRAAFTRELAERLARPGGDRLVVCCLDVDRFNAVNDTLGYVAGDQLLRVIADRLRALAAPEDWTTARLEGDQFVLLIEPVAGRDRIAAAVDRIFHAFDAPFHLSGVELAISVSAGVAGQGRAGASGPGTAHGLIQDAQIALHWAKTDGRAHWRRFEPDRAAAAADRYRLSADIPKGLRQGQFTLHYQPLVDLASGQVVAYEALARWHHPRRGLLPANRFIGLVEHSGLIVPLGNHLLAEACRQAATWRKHRGGGPYVSVNVSGAQLHQTQFARYVAEVLDRSRLSPPALQVEVTEEVIIETARAASSLEQLAELGVRVAVDDFGTGYSNLLRLRELPFHRLKLDAAFVQRGRPRPAAMGGDTPEEFLAATVALGHTLDLEVTAEGLETADQAAQARDAGCDTGQGWHFGRPLPPHQVQQAVRSGAPRGGFSPTPPRPSRRSAPASPPARRD
jgi:diguanylate cyclase (GGDEF)-like protein